MQQRYYDPVVGRFYSNDPVDFMGHMQRGNSAMGFNRYAYANNNPYKYTDPDGEFIQVLMGAAACAIGETASQMIEGKGYNGSKIAANALMGGNAGESLVHDSIEGKAGDLGKAATAAYTSVSGLGNSGTMQKIVGDSVQGKLTSQGVNQTAAQGFGAVVGAVTASGVKAAEKMMTEKDQLNEKKQSRVL
jgi:hypothetical protein